MKKPQQKKLSLSVKTVRELMDDEPVTIAGCGAAVRSAGTAGSQYTDTCM